MAFLHTNRIPFERKYDKTIVGQDLLGFVRKMNRECKKNKEN